MDQFSQLSLFAKIAELNSLTKAAAEMQMSTSAASRSLLALEERLGIRLVQRTTRRLWLTEAGNAYYERCRAILADVQEADDAARSMATEPTGTLTVTSSLSFALLHIAPVLSPFSQRYPGLTVRLVAENRYQDFIANGIDVAIRTRDSEPDSGISIRKLGETRRVIAASPSYLHRFGMPQVPEDLEGHNALAYSLYKDAWEPRFTKEGESARQVKLAGNFESNDGQILRTAALSGHGYLIQSGLLLDDDLRCGKLVEILPDWRLSGMTINIAFQSRRHLAAKVRAFVDFMLEQFRFKDFP